MPAFEAELLETIPRTDNISSFRFSNPVNLQFEAGQYFIITIKEGDNTLVHHFSFSNSPTEIGYLEFTTRLRDSEFKNALIGLKKGDTVKLNGPFGEFLLKVGAEKISMLSGGIGITPFRSMIKYCTDKRLKTKITLIYGNRSEADIAFKDELDIMQKENSNLKVVHTLSETVEGWSGYKGHIDESMIKKEIPDYADNIFYCSGPPGMVKVIGDLILNIGVNKDNIIRENFSGY